MEGCTQIAPLKLVRLRRVANVRDTWLSEQVDPLRRLIRRHNHRNSQALQRLKQIEAIEKAGVAGPIERLGE